MSTRKMLVLSFGLALHGVLFSDPLHIAALKLDLKTMHELFKQGERVNSGPVLGLRPLHCAVFSGVMTNNADLQISGITALITRLDSPAQINAQDAWGATPRDYAEYYGQTQVAGVLGWHRGVRAKEPGLAPMLHRLLLHDRKSDLVIDDELSVNQADAFGRTPLHIAAMIGFRFHVTALLNAGARVDLPDEQGWTPLCYAAYFNHPEVVGLLIEVGAEPNVEDAEGNTPFILAARGGNLAQQVMELLVAADANVDHCAKHGETALHYAAAVGRCGTIEYLLNCVKDKNPKNAAGASPLMLAAIRGRTHVFEMINDFYRNKKKFTQDEIKTWVAARAPDGRTLQHLAASMGHYSVVLHLLDLGLDPAAKTLAGTSVLDAARDGLERWLLFQHAMQASEVRLQIPYSKKGKENIIKDFEFHKLGLERREKEAVS